MCGVSSRRFPPPATFGVGSSFTAPRSVGFPGPWKYVRLPLSPSAFAGVGNNPDAISPVPRADGTSRKYNRPRFVTEAFQVSETIVECHADEASNVLTKDPAGPHLANNASHFRPEVTVIRRASALPGNGPRLARKSPGEQGDWLSHKLACEGSDVIVDSHIGPMLSKNLLTEWIDLAELHGLITSPSRSQREAADTRKEIEMRFHGTNQSMNVA